MLWSDRIGLSYIYFFKQYTRVFLLFFFFSKTIHGVWGFGRVGLKKTPGTVFSGEFLFWKKNVIEPITNFDKNLQVWIIIAPRFLMLEKNVDHPSLQRFNPGSWIVLKKMLLCYDATLVLLFISIQINYKYPIKIYKLSHFCLVKVGFSVLLVIFLFKM